MSGRDVEKAARRVTHRCPRPLSAVLELADVPPEPDDLTPEHQQPTVLAGEVAVEGLQESKEQTSLKSPLHVAPTAVSAASLPHLRLSPPVRLLLFQFLSGSCPVSGEPADVLAEGLVGYAGLF